jgi:hypothetical protein
VREPGGGLGNVRLDVSPPAADGLIRNVAGIVKGSDSTFILSHLI